MFKKTGRSVYVVSFFITLFSVVLYFIDVCLDTGLLLSSFERKWFDFKVSYNEITKIFIKRFPEADPRIVIVAIDDETIKKYGWPFPRKYYAKAIEKLIGYGTKVVAFDLMFFDPDSQNPDSDRYFVETVDKYRDRVIIATTIDDDMNLIFPFTDLHKSAERFGSIFAGHMIDYDGNFRKIFPFLSYLESSRGSMEYLYSDICLRCADKMNDVGIPLLGTMAYIVYTSSDIRSLYQRWKEKSFYIKFRKSRLLYDEFSPTMMYKSISLKSIIENTLNEEDKNRFKNSIVFMGSVARGAYDHYATPVGQHTPGIEMHAICADSLLNDDYFREVPVYIDLALLIFFIWLPVILIRSSVIKISLFNFAAVILLMFLSLFLINYNINQPFMIFFIPNITSFIYVVSYKSLVEDRQKRWIKNTFSQYLSPEIVDILVKDPSKLKLGGERRELTVFFMDIAGFTSISEKISPEEVINILNFYLSSLSDIILEEKGVIDKYIGDCIMAFWNAPVDIKDHRLRAVRAGIRCINKIKELIPSNNSPKVSVRIGINSGYAVVGNMGSNKRFAYTVLGDTVNLASRLEGANKFFGTSIMASSDVVEGIKDTVVCKYIGKILVVGKSEVVEVYEPFKLKDDMNEYDFSFIKNFENGIKYFYEKRYNDAADFFDKALSIIPHDKLSIFYRNLIKELKESKTEFNGIFNIRSK